MPDTNEVVTRRILREELSNYPTRAEFHAEFARHARAMEEMFRHYFGVLDDKLTR